VTTPEGEAVSNAIDPQGLGIETRHERRGNYKIHLNGIEPGVFVAAFWNNARPEQGGRTEAMSSAEGQQIFNAASKPLDHPPHGIAYAPLAIVHGRRTCIECWGAYFITSGYDRHNGDGLLIRILQQVRATGAVDRLQ
jgi:hypothetical protein